MGEKENKGTDQTQQKPEETAMSFSSPFLCIFLCLVKIPLLQERFSTVRKRSVLGFVGIFLFIVHRQNLPIQVLFVSGFIVTLFTLKQSCFFSLVYALSCDCCGLCNQH